ncbi:hypothetical protein ACWD4L_36465 [Streptomyces sp. NPDC002596]
MDQALSAAGIDDRARRALDLEQAALHKRDERGAPFTERLLWATVSAWRPSAHEAGLIGLELDGRLFTHVPEHARPVWEQWLAGPPEVIGA